MKDSLDHTQMHFSAKLSPVFNEKNQEQICKVGITYLLCNGPESAHQLDAGRFSHNVPLTVSAREIITFACQVLMSLSTV